MSIAHPPPKAVSGSREAHRNTPQAYFTFCEAKYIIQVALGCNAT